MSVSQHRTRFDVTLVGESNLDLLLYGLPEELPPERELLASCMELVLGGSPAITAHNLAALGSRVGLVTTLAADPFAQMCRRELEAAGVDLTRALPFAREKGTGVTVLLEHAGFRRSLTYAGATAELRYADLDLDYLQSARHFHLSSFFLQRGLRPDVPRLFAELKSAGLTLSMDTNDDPEGLWGASRHDELEEAVGWIDILMPNEREACMIAGEEDVESAIARLRERVPLLVVKRGRRGAAAYRGAETCEQSPPDVTAVDAVGAGDSFNAGFLHGFVKGRPLQECLRLGNRAGAWSTTQPGGTTAFRDRAATERFLAI